MVELTLKEALKRTKATPGGRRIPHDLRIELYHFVRDLHRRGVSYSGIQRIVEEKYGVWISRSNISYWVRGMHTPEKEPYNKPDFSRPEMAWIAGMLAGDGSIKVNKKGRFLSLKAKDRELVEEAARKLAIVMGREKPYAVNKLGDGRYYVRVQSRELVDHLSVRENALNYLRRNPNEFIRAFFDCDGYVSASVDSVRNFRYEIGLTNTDKQLLLYIKAMLESMGIESKIYKAYSKGKIFFSSRGKVQARKSCYTLKIKDFNSISRFLEMIGSSIERKRTKLVDIVDILGSNRGIYAAIEWLRRYERRPNEGKEKWFRRKKPLTIEEAWSLI